MSTQFQGTKTMPRTTQFVARMIVVLLAMVMGLNSASAQSFPSQVLKDIYDQSTVSPQCENPSFDLGFSGWTGFRARRAASSLPIQGSLGTATVPAPLLSTSCISASGIGNTGPGNTCVMTESAGADTNITNISLPKVVHGSSSVRLGGNAMLTGKSNGNGVEGVAKRFVVQSANSIYKFRFSTVMEKAHVSGSGTTFTGVEPFFQAIAIDPVTGTVIDKVDFISSSFNPQFIDGPANSGLVYSPWQCTKLDLSAYVGKEVAVYFINSDCAAGAHTAYTYVDDTCALCNKPEDVGLTIDPTVDLKICEPDKKSKITGQILIPIGTVAKNIKVKLDIRQGGSIITTLTNGVITGGIYSFDLSLSDLIGIGCYDLVATLEYDVTTPAGNVVHVVKTTDVEGTKPGKDNDFCLVDCDKPPVEKACLSSDAKVTCGEKLGTYVITLSTTGAGGVLPTSVSITPKTAGVTIINPQVSYPVVGGQVKIVVAGAKPGDVLDFDMEGTTAGAGFAAGTDLCCNGMIKVTIPKDLECKQPDISILKTGPKTCLPGQPCTFTITITNNGAPYNGNVLLWDQVSPNAWPVTAITPNVCGTSITTTPFSCVANLNLVANQSTTFNVTMTSSFNGTLVNENCMGVAFAPSWLSPNTSYTKAELEKLFAKYGPLKSQSESCWKVEQGSDKVDIAIKKTGATTPALNVPFYSFKMDITNEGSAYTAGAGVLTVTDFVPAGMTFTSVTGTAGWSCAPNTNVPAGTLITCTYAGGALAAGPASPVGTINISARANGKAPFPPFENCANVNLTPATGAIDSVPTNNKSCVTVSKKDEKSTIKVDKVCAPAKEVIGAINSFVSDCKITVTTTGPQTALIVVNEAMSGGGTVVSAVSSTAPAWSCSTANCSINGSLLNQTSSVSVIDVMVKFNNAGQVGESQNCARLSVGQNPVPKPDGQACTKFNVDNNAFKLDVKKDCSGIIALTANGPWAGNCKVTVLATGGPRPAVIAINDAISYANTSNTLPIQMTNMQSVDPWVCGAPSNNGGNLNCKIQGNAFPANGISVLDILVQVPIGVKSGEAQNCVNAIGDNDGQAQSQTAPLYSTQVVCVALPGGKASDVGRLLIEKVAILNGSNLPQASYPMIVTCGSTVSPINVTAGVGPEIVANIPPNATCLIVEPAPPTAGLCDAGQTGTWTTSYSPAMPVIVPVGDTNVTVTNTLNCDPIVKGDGQTTFSVSKKASYNGQPILGTPFQMNVTCDNGTAQSLSVFSDQSQTISGLPASTTCNVVEGKIGKANLCPQGSTEQWATTYVPTNGSNTTSRNSSVVVQVNNLLTCKKVVIDPIICENGFVLVVGKGCVPIISAPKCDSATTVSKGDKCVCEYRNMVQVSKTACGCAKGFKFADGKGCYKPVPICKKGQRFQPARDRCEPVCAKGFDYNPKRNVCIQTKPDCPQGTIYNAKRNRCDPAQPVCRKPFVYDTARNACVEVIKQGCGRGQIKIAGKCRVIPNCPFGQIPIPGTGICVSIGGGGGDKPREQRQERTPQCTPNAAGECL